ncbi:MAG: carboxylating nicotinate-nucleotide diphosphorylase [Thioalkalispiraceae bacterium]|jgi:nicotinate-nucleotide pyrophosphorylase (carboxylating)
MLIHIPRTYIDTQVTAALEEDVGDGDITAMLIPENKLIMAEVICRESAVLCGKDWFNLVFEKLSANIELRWQKNDGDEIQQNEVICDLSGPARAILTGERSALNFLQTLSGTATTTRQFARAIADTNCQVLDTRKTIPGYRLAQKYAVHCGGGSNHRLGLYDMVLIKENHITAAGSIANAVQAARQLAPGFDIEVEVETLEELQQALDCGVTRILLDNMNPAQLLQAVELNAGKAKLEASGNVNLDTVHSIAETGVDYVSVGSMTKHIRAIDFSMRFSEF